MYFAKYKKHQGGWDMHRLKRPSFTIAVGEPGCRQLLSVSTWFVYFRCLKLFRYNRTFSSYFCCLLLKSEMSMLLYLSIFILCFNEGATDCYSDISEQLSNIDQSLKKKSQEIEDLTALHSSPHIKRLHNVDNMLNSLFLDTFMVGKKKYFLSRALTVNYDVALSTCYTNGLKLAEIESGKELSLVAKVVDKYSHIQNVWIGVNDLKEDGKYVYTDSGRPAFTKFADSDPKGQSMESCVTIRRQYNWSMADSLCISFNQEHYHFLCQMLKP
ncbi:hypothetical protein Btru_074488 [Bulinus truncatus]|nr:hypothetical protein Btru_074488 [Bulinus truncatus]